MQELVELAAIEIDAKITGGAKLPETMILYAMAADHFVIASKSLKKLEDTALAKTRVSLVTQDGRILICVGSKIYGFYHLEENDYTVMVSGKDPTTIVVTI